jgi:cysteamine dioxygenase
MTAYAQMANGHQGKWNPNTKLNWDAFLERLTKLAKSQHQLPWDQKHYTEQVKQLLLQCNFPEFKNIKREIDLYENRRPNWFESANLHNEVDFQVSLFQFEKGEYIPLHDHPNMTGVLNIFSGSIVTKNYTIEEKLASTREIVKNGRKRVLQQCTLRETQNETLKAGTVGILTSHEGNIHSLMPNEYTQMVDVFTPAYSYETNSSWYKINEDEFYKGKEKLYLAEYSNTML